MKRALPVFFVSAIMLMFGCSLPWDNPPPVNQTNETFACPDGTNVTDLSLCPEFPVCPTTCDDNNSCTYDYCGTQTQHQCFHTPENGGQSGCSGPLGSPGYVSIKYGYSILPPAGWRVDDGEAVRLGVVSFTGPQVGGGFIPVFEIAYSSVMPNETLDSLASSAKSGLALGLQNFTLASDSEATLAGLEARRLLYSYASESLSLMGDYYVLLDGKRAYSVKYLSTNESFGEYHPAFEAAAATFALSDYSSVCTAQACSKGLCTEYGLCEGCTEDCDDGNPCTYDYCDIRSGVQCRHLSMTGPQPGCSGEPGGSGYVSVEYGYSITPPEGWKTAQEDGLTVFSAPPGLREFTTGFSIAA
ncbi:MAG: hypothetical protein NT157_00815, partial [Candidatus Micrarchaeota archaeon]|nr:hypothetical protein [Candidatus Micrarchaeota archaeon]